MAKSKKHTDPRIERTRARVLTAARDLLREGGPTAVTYSELAARSGVGRATLYRHWPDLNLLWSDLVSEFGRRMKLDLTGDLRADLMRALESMAAGLASAERRMGMIDMMQRAQWDKETRRLARMTRAHTPVRQALAHGLTTGTLPDSLNLDLATALLSGPLLHHVFVNGGVVDSTFIADVVEAFLATNTDPTAL